MKLQPKLDPKKHRAEALLEITTELAGARFGHFDRYATNGNWIVASELLAPKYRQGAEKPWTPKGVSSMKIEGEHLKKALSIATRSLSTAAQDTRFASTSIAFVYHNLPNQYSQEEYMLCRAFVSLEALDPETMRPRVVPPVAFLQEAYVRAFNLTVLFGSKITGGTNKAPWLREIDFVDDEEGTPGGTVERVQKVIAPVFIRSVDALPNASEGALCLREQPRSFWEKAITTQARKKLAACVDDIATLALWGTM